MSTERLAMNKVRRSREGAWIEIYADGILDKIQSGRSREGAWIEIRMSG